MIFADEDFELDPWMDSLTPARKGQALHLVSKKWVATWSLKHEVGATLSRHYNYRVEAFANRVDLGSTTNASVERNNTLSLLDQPLLRELNDAHSS